jgi:hypothetical protein
MSTTLAALPPSTNPSYGWPGAVNILGLTAEPDYQRLLEESLISATNVIEKPPVCLEVHREGNASSIATLGNISMLIGKAKQGKTFAVSMALAAASKDALFQGTLRACLPEGQKGILLFDTEQGNYHAQRVLKRICQMLEVEEPANLSVHVLRKYTPAERLGIIEYAIYNTPGIGLVVIDGIRDLITSINDEDQATMITSKLLKWTAERNIHIITVLHMNKGDQNARGHLGSELTNKCETVVSVGKSSADPNVIVVQSEFTRDKDFEPFAFSIDENGLPYILNTWLPAKTKSLPAKQDADLRPEEVASETHAVILKHVFAKQKEMLHSELKAAAKEHLSRWKNKNVGDGRVADWINYWIRVHMVSQQGKSKSRASKYSNNTTATLPTELD